MRAFLLICVSALLCPGGFVKPVPPGSHAKDEEAIQKLLDDSTGAWNRHDMRPWSEQFTEDADFVVITGRHLKGRDEIFTYHDELHKGVFKDHSGSAKLKDLRFLRPDIAIGHVAFEGTSTSDPKVKTTALGTVVLAKQKGKWLVTAFHNTRLSGPPPGAPSAGPK